MREHKLFLAGSKIDGADIIKIRSPFDGRVVAQVARGDTFHLEAAADAAVRAGRLLAAFTPAARGAVLERAATIVGDLRNELAGAVSEEAGKPIALALAEVDRCGDTLRESAWVARHPEIVAQDLAGCASSPDRLALIRRVPVGPVLAITPFNFPLNLVAHKLAPAIAAGCPVVLKPASQTPGPAILFAEILAEAGLPPGALSVIPSRASDAQGLVGDPRFGLLTFTGSMDVGWKLKQLAWRHRVGLELGGNAAVIVDSDTEDLAAAASRIAGAAFAYAGQSCISVQRILVHEDIFVRFRRHMIAAAEELATGDPSLETTVCGPMIDDANASRVEQWIRDGEEAGGRRLCGGGRTGNVVAPTLLEEVPSTESVVAEEVFGPVAVLDAYEDFAQAIHIVNDSRFGLQLGVFSRDLYKIQEAWSKAEVGGVIQGDVPTWRSDPMPYGGVKDSGAGREGPLFAYREMTEERLLVLRR